MKDRILELFFTKNDMNEEIRNKFICWSAEMDIRYDKIFSIIDIKEENMKKWGEVLPFYKNVQKEGVILCMEAYKNLHDISTCRAEHNLFYRCFFQLIRNWYFRLL